MEQVYVVKFVNGEEWLCALDEEDFDGIMHGTYECNIILISKPFGVIPNPDKKEHPDDPSVSNFIIYPVSIAKTDCEVPIFTSSVMMISPAQPSMANVYAQNTGMLVSGKPELVIQ